MTKGEHKIVSEQLAAAFAAVSYKLTGTREFLQNRLEAQFGGSYVSIMNLTFEACSLQVFDNEDDEVYVKGIFRMDATVCGDSSDTFKGTYKCARTEVFRRSTLRDSMPDVYALMVSEGIL